VDFFATPDDNIFLVKWILEHTNLELIPDVPLKEPRIVTSKVIDENIEKCIRNNRILYMWEKRFYPVFPLDFSHHQRDGKEWYNMYRSPSLVYSTSHYVTNEEGDWLRCVSGYLTYTKELYNKENHSVIPVPQPLKDEYQKVMKLVKQKLKKIKNKNLWLGEEVFDLFMKGELEIYSGNLGKWISCKDIV
jgi:hypothetical protein